MAGIVDIAPPADDRGPGLSCSRGRDGESGTQAPSGTSLFGGRTPCHQCDLHDRQPGRDPSDPERPRREANGELSERIETIVRTALEASTMTRRLIELSHDLTAIDLDSSAGPVEEIHLADGCPQFVETEKDKLAAQSDWCSTWLPSPRSEAGPNSSAPC